MKKNCMQLVCVFVFIAITTGFAFGEEDTQVLQNNSLESSSQEQDSVDVKKNWGLAITEAIGSDLFLLGVNRFVRNAPYAYISWDSMHTNLTNPWVWDQDEFSVNQIGHPYQGSVYFIAGRANNLSYWESYVPTVVGSVFWEIFMETESPSINDFIVTTYGGAALGEMLHRIYLETEKADSWLSLVVSPMGSLNFAITGKPSMKVPEKIERLDVKFSLGSMVSFRGFESDLKFHEVNEVPVTIGGGLDIVYGNPYGHETSTPYSHFELNTQIDWSRKYHSASFFSNGLLWSIAPPWNEKNADTTFGVSQHYDFVISNDLWYNSNAVGLTIKQKVYLGEITHLNWALHLNWMILGSSEYYYFLTEGNTRDDVEEERRDYDLSTGENLKFSLSVGNKRMGTFGIVYIFNGMHTIAGSVPEGGSAGFTLIGLAGLSYEHQLFSEKYLLGISNTLYHKTGFYKNAENLTTINGYSSLYFKIRYK